MQWQRRGGIVAGHKFELVQPGVGHGGAGDADLVVRRAAAHQLLAALVLEDGGAHGNSAGHGEQAHCIRFDLKNDRDVQQLHARARYTRTQRTFMSVPCNSKRTSVQSCSSSAWAQFEGAASCACRAVGCGRRRGDGQ